MAGRIDQLRPVQGVEVELLNPLFHKVEDLFGDHGGRDKASRFGVFVEGRYQFNFTEDERTDFASLRGGVRIGL